jgi:hypothetical protein
LKQNYRAVLGDNPEDLTDVKYGNNNVMGPDKNEILHGTHVAELLPARGNNREAGARKRTKTLTTFLSR